HAYIPVRSHYLLKEQGLFASSEWPLSTFNMIPRLSPTNCRSWLLIAARILLYCKRSAHASMRIIDFHRAEQDWERRQRGQHNMEHATNMSVATTVHESSLLLTLEEISQLISHSHNPHETLGNIVRLIQGRFCTDVSSVYLLEPESGELVLAATVGLDQSGVGRVRMRLDEGLTGLVAERMSPIMEPDAFIHPRFKYFPEAGEDPYHSFLGVPLIESGIVQGVLVVQTMERRPFSPNEIR